MACLYAVTLLLSLYQITRIIFHRHNILHYQFVFLAFLFFWSAVRVVFLPFVNWSSDTEEVLNGVAIVIQFATFSFVVLFYAQMVHRRSASRFFGKFAVLIYLVVNIIIIALFIGICFDLNQLVTAQAIFNGCAYVILSVAVTAYGWKLKSLIGNKEVKVPFLKYRKALFTLTVILSLIFLIRAIWNFLLAAENENSWLNLVPIIQVGCPCPVIRDQVIVSVMLIVWEVIPSAIMLGIFWKIPKKAKPIKPLNNHPPSMHIYQRVPTINHISINTVDSTTETD